MRHWACATSLEDILTQSYPLTPCIPPCCLELQHQTASFPWRLLDRATSYSNVIGPSGPVLNNLLHAQQSSMPSDQLLPICWQRTPSLLQLMPCGGHDGWEILGTLHYCSEYCCSSLLWCVAVSFNKKLPAAYMVPARCSCMVLVWAASPSRLSAYSFVIGVMVAAFKRFFKPILCLGALAFISESNVFQVELLFAFQFC